MKVSYQKLVLAASFCLFLLPLLSLCGYAQTISTFSGPASLAINYTATGTNQSMSASSPFTVTLAGVSGTVNATVTDGGNGGHIVWSGSGNNNVQAYTASGSKSFTYTPAFNLKSLATPLPIPLTVTLSTGASAQWLLILNMPTASLPSGFSYCLPLSVGANAQDLTTLNTVLMTFRPSEPVTPAMLSTGPAKYVGTNPTTGATLSAQDYPNGYRLDRIIRYSATGAAPWTVIDNEDYEEVPSAAILVAFKPQATITAGTTDTTHYQMCWGNASYTATTNTDPAVAWNYANDFTGAGSGSTAVTSNNLTQIGNATASFSGNVASLTNLTSGSYNGLMTATLPNVTASTWNPIEVFCDVALHVPVSATVSDTTGVFTGSNLAASAAYEFSYKYYSATASQTGLFSVPSVTTGAAYSPSPRVPLLAADEWLHMDYRQSLQAQGGSYARQWRCGDVPPISYFQNNSGTYTTTSILSTKAGVFAPINATTGQSASYRHLRERIAMDSLPTVSTTVQPNYQNYAVQPSQDDTFRPLMKHRYNVLTDPNLPSNKGIGYLPIVSDGNLPYVTDVNALSLTNSPTGGTYALTVTNNRNLGVSATTTTLNYNATAAQVQTALQALANVGPNGMLVTGTNPNFTITSAGSCYGVSSTISGNGALLTGAGAQPAATVSHTTVGSGPTDNLASINADISWLNITAGGGYLYFPGGGGGYNVLSGTGSNVYLDLTNSVGVALQGDGGDLDLNEPNYAKSIGMIALPPSVINYGPSTVPGSSTVTTAFMNFKGVNADTALLRLRLVSLVPPGCYDGSATGYGYYQNTRFQSNPPNHVFVKGCNFVMGYSGYWSFLFATSGVSGIQHLDVEDNTFDGSTPYRWADVLSIDGADCAFVHNSLLYWGGRIRFEGHHGPTPYAAPSMIVDQNVIARLGGVHAPHLESDGLDGSFSEGVSFTHNNILNIGTVDMSAGDNDPLLWQIGGASYYGYNGTVGAISGDGLTITDSGSPGWNAAQAAVSPAPTWYNFGVAVDTEPTSPAKGSWAYIGPYGLATNHTDNTLTVVGPWQGGSGLGLAPLVGDRYAITQWEASNVDVSHNTFQNWLAAVDLYQGGAGVAFHDNTLINSGSGVWFRGAGTAGQHWGIYNTSVYNNYIAEPRGLHAPQVDILASEGDTTTHGTLVNGNKVYANQIAALVPGNPDFSLTQNGETVVGGVFLGSIGVGGASIATTNAGSVSDLSFLGNFPGLNQGISPFNASAQAARPLIPYVQPGQSNSRSR